MGLRKCKDGAYIFIFVGIVLLLMLIYESIYTGFDINNKVFLFCVLSLIVCFFFGIRKLLKRIRVNKMGKELTQNGKKIEARVLLILRIPNKNNGRGSYLDDMKYKIVAKYMKETFCSEEYFTNLNKVVKKGDKIDVYIDENDHSRYWMDVDSLFEKPEDVTMIVN